MKYTDFDEIVVDKYSGYVFGPEDQLTVLGWVDKVFDNAGKHKKGYLCLCHLCEKDNELFGDGVFKSTKSAINAGQLPCGCSKKPTWSEVQLKIRLERKAAERGYQFLGFSEPYKKATTKLILSCPEHGIWNRMSAHAFLSNQSCPGCSNAKRKDSLIKHNTYSDEQFIESFIATGFYPEATVFTRSDKQGSRGRCETWKYFCSLCQSWAESTATGIKAGRKSCECSTYNPIQAYIKVLKSLGTPIALKYGIANKAANRVHRNCAYDIFNHSFWEFPSRKQTVEAERLCDIELATCVVNKQNMPDGYTETTHLNNLEAIICIYKDFGGVLIQEFDNVFSAKLG